MPDDGGPDVEIVEFDGTLENRLRFTDDFWHRLFAGLALASEYVGECCTPTGAAERAYKLADAMIAHKKNTEADGETDNERG